MSDVNDDPARAELVQPSIRSSVDPNYAGIQEFLWTCDHVADCQDVKYNVVTDYAELMQLVAG